MTFVPTAADTLPSGINLRLLLVRCACPAELLTTHLAVLPLVTEAVQASEMTPLEHAGHDFDGDTVEDQDEYPADSNPLDISDYLWITRAMQTNGGANARLTWRSEPTRFYYVKTTEVLSNGAVWTDSGLGLVTPVLHEPPAERKVLSWAASPLPTAHPYSLVSSQLVCQRSRLYQ